MNHGAARRAAIAAAVEVGELSGIRRATPVVLQDTNNVVVWLAPHDVVAKVGVMAHSAEVLGREVDVGAHLAAAGAPVAAPLGQLRVARSTPWPVSLWERLEPARSQDVSDGALAGALRDVHTELETCTVALPSYLDGIARSRTTLFDDRRMGSLARSDLQVLRTVFDGCAARARDSPALDRPLHGEPHRGNIIVTEGGPFLIDFEGASLGPTEWDLASLPPGVATSFEHLDDELLALLRLLNHARVATWCWAMADQPSMRVHAEHHLGIVRAAAR